MLSASARTLRLLSISPRALGQPGPRLRNRGPRDQIQYRRRGDPGGLRRRRDWILPIETVLAHVQSAASAVTTYYGRFPVDRARQSSSFPCRSGGILQGTTWGDMAGFQGFTRIRIGQHTTTAELAADWTTTHELVHMAFPSLPAISTGWKRVWPPTLSPSRAFRPANLTRKKDLERHGATTCTKASPRRATRGWTTPTPGAALTGAGPCFASSPMSQIRRETGNRKGLQDALRAIVAHGGTIDHDWESATGARNRRSRHGHPRAHTDVREMERHSHARRPRQTLERSGNSFHCRMALSSRPPMAHDREALRPRQS